MQKPTSSEYIPSAKNYIDLVPEGNFPDLLKRNQIEVSSFFSSLPADKEDFRYAANKWSVKEILMHIVDAERVFAYRALTLARGDADAVFPKMDEELFAANADVSGRSLIDIVHEFTAVRLASLCLFGNFSKKQLRTEGKLFDYPVTPLGFGYVIIGHPLHHIKIVNERYLS